MRSPFLLLGCLPLLVAGCVLDPEGPAGPPPELVTEGTYDLHSPMDLTAAAIVPDPVSGYLGVLVRLRDDPAGAMFSLLEDAGVPLASDLLSLLPDALASRLAGWINDAIRGAMPGGTKYGDAMDGIISLSSTVITRFDLESHLVLQRTTDPANPSATHALDGLAWAPAGLTRVTVPVAPIAGGPFVVSATVSASITAGRDGADASLQLGDHAFGFPYGQYAWQALQSIVLQRYGTDLRGVLGQTVGCAGMASSVASKCLLSLCVGHQQTLQDICDSALDLAVEKVHGQIAGLSFDAVHLKRGDAALWDVLASEARDGRVDRIAGGVWQAAIDAGSGARDVPATFSGRRRQ